MYDHISVAFSAATCLSWIFDETATISSVILVTLCTFVFAWTEQDKAAAAIVIVDVALGVTIATLNWMKFRTCEAARNNGVYTYEWVLISVSRKTIYWVEYSQDNLHT